MNGVLSSIFVILQFLKFIYKDSWYEDLKHVGSKWVLMKRTLCP